MKQRCADDAVCVLEPALKRLLHDSAFEGITVAFELDPAVRRLAVVEPDKLSRLVEAEIDLIAGMDARHRATGVAGRGDFMNRREARHPRPEADGRAYRPDRR
ncbi:MAG: hypothetical protein U5K73_05605 [Halofilum sp. (in: g-proteobacteria)]|nr:hypothetical protein [Halofilum sp. (in: g-proteobacteria)]